MSREPELFSFGLPELSPPDAAVALRCVSPFSPGPASEPPLCRRRRAAFQIIQGIALEKRKFQRDYSCVCVCVCKEIKGIHACKHATKTRMNV